MFKAFSKYVTQPGMSWFGRTLKVYEAVGRPTVSISHILQLRQTDCPTPESNVWLRHPIVGSLSAKILEMAQETWSWNFLRIFSKHWAGGWVMNC